MALLSCSPCDWLKAWDPRPQHQDAKVWPRTMTALGSVRGIFVAEFHVRTGNAIVFRDPPDLATDGLEWKVLPSGAHAVQRDVIYFAYDEEHMGVASYYARKLTKEEGADEQRGARCVSVGLIVRCAQDPSSQLRHLLPHLPDLTRLAMEVAHGAEPPTVALYKQKYTPDGALPTPSMLERLAYDPATYMLSTHRFLGPLVVPLLKLMLLPRRLLLYAPAPVERAAMVAFNLAELVHAAFAYAMDAPGQVMIYGMLTLHDLDAWKRVASSASSWIAWTSDRILLDKTDTYDVCLDLSALSVPHAADAPAPARPLARFVENAALRPSNLTWSSRDLSLFLELAEQERRYELLLVDEGRPTFDAWRSAENLPTTCALHMPPGVSWRYMQQDARGLLLGYMVVWIASLRFWLTEWWLIRSQLHIALPLSLVAPQVAHRESPMSESFADVPREEDASIDSVPASVGATTAIQPTDRMATSLDSMDPLVAAYGLSLRAKPSGASRLSTPSLSSPQPSMHTLPAERTIIPAHPRFDPEDIPHLPLESMAGMYVFTLWSSYLRARYIQASALLHARVASLPHVDESSALLAPRTVLITSAMFRQLGLHASSSVDRSLLQHWLEPFGGTLQVTQTWWFW